VDAAEAEPEVCARLNREAPRLIAEACAALDIPFVHLSTDYVFDGEKAAPYVEADPRAPINVYGRTKAEGEAALEAMAPARRAVIRTSWVFAAGGGGFLAAMLQAAAERDEARVVDDQRGSPTPASAVADAALTVLRALLDRDPHAESLFHAAGCDGVSRADFAEAIFARTPRRPRLIRIATSELAPTPARRPRDTRLSSARLETALGWRAPSLAEALDACLKETAS
jgi:dTDP-4-dehydrorhamnose reductase